MASSALSSSLSVKYFICSDSLFLYQCKKCVFSTDKINNYFIHRCEVQSNNECIIYECDQCGITSHSILWQLHHQNSHPLSDYESKVSLRLYRKFQCDQCSFSTNRKYYLDTHKHALHTDKIIWFTCEVCNWETRYLRSFNTHMVVKHSMGGNKLHECDECNYETRLKYNMTRHIKSKHSPSYLSKMHICSICKFGTRDRSDLLRHISAKHTPDDQRVWYSCHMCTFKSKRRYNLIAHLQSRHGTRNAKHKCNECIYETYSKANLQSHIILKHTAEDLTKWYNCSICNYQSKVARSLRVHIERKHLGMKNIKKLIEEYICTNCTYKANDLLDLRKHLKFVHSAPQKRFECNFCVYATDNRRHLQPHINSKHYSDEEATWHSCTKCTYKAKRSGTLKLHMLTTHSHESKIKCGVCSFLAVTERVLKEHINDKHTPDELAIWYNCNKCTYKTKSYGNLRVHSSRNHSISKRKC